MLSRQGIGAALILALMLAPGNCPAGGDAPGPDAGRAAPPPAEWLVVDHQKHTGPLGVQSNITVWQGGFLELENATVSASGAGASPAISVMSGGALSLVNSSIAGFTSVLLWPGADLDLRDSRLDISGSFNCSGNFSAVDSAIVVAGAPGNASSASGAPATLVLGGAWPGILRRSTIRVAGGNGQPGAPGDGKEGGAGGNVTLRVHADSVKDSSLTALAGNGGNGGTPGITTASGGCGGNGGGAVLVLTADRVSNSAIALCPGNGGDGPDGMTTSNLDGGHGGGGGDGGSADFSWTGTGLALDVSKITVAAGSGGEGGIGGQSQTAGRPGGNGACGGSGGGIVASIISGDALRIEDSVLAFVAGNGSAGGTFGRASGGGKDGAAGDGGDGGAAYLIATCWDLFSSANSTLTVAAGNGGSGGLGSTGGHGADGGGSLLHITARDSRTWGRTLLGDSTLSSIGGNGGSGGKGLSVGQSKGQPGDGGRGGVARLFINCSDNLTADRSHLDCDEGQGGAADSPARTGNPGVGTLFIFAQNVLLRNCTYSQTMGWVDNNDYWRLERTFLLRKNQHPTMSHFLPITENGTVEEYMGELNVRVQDIWGNIITDGSVNVTVYSGEKLLAWKRSDASGLAVFSFITRRYTAKEIWSFSGSVNATRDGGGNSYPVHTFGYGNITVTIISKRFPPFCVIISPDDRISPVIDAGQFIRRDGTIEMYLIEGTAQDDSENALPAIEGIVVKIGDDGAWMPANLEMVSLGYYKWNLTWDVYRWAEEQLKRYPAGVIPCPISARAWNGIYWSDDIEQGGSTVRVNLTVTLLKIPPPPPKIEITSPVLSGTQSIGMYNISYERPVHFDARVIRSYGTKIIRWEWYVEHDGVPRLVSSSPDRTDVNITFPIEWAGEYVDVILVVFDNESKRRVELFRAGVSYDEFRYDFDPNDGSISVKLRVYITEPPDGPDHPPPNYWPFIFLCVLVVVLYLSFMLAAQRQRLVRDRLSRRK